MAAIDGHDRDRDEAVHTLELPLEPLDVPPTAAVALGQEGGDGRGLTAL